MKTEAINRKNYEKPAFVVIKLYMKPIMLVDSDEYYYEGAPDD